MSRTEFAISLKLLDEKFKKGMKGVKNQLSNFKSWIASAFAVGSILDFAKSIASVGSAFQSQMARVKAVSGATKEEFKAMSDEAKRLGASTKYSSQQAAEALEYLTRNGLKAKDATEALEHVLKLASSQAIELSQAADIATTVMNAFGLEVKDLTKVNDVLAATTSNSATNITDLSEALKVAAPIAKTLNIGIEETNAALGVLANNGYRGSQAGTALRIILSRISSQTPKAAEALKRYGLTLSEADLKADGLLETLRKLSNVNIDFSDLTTIFGQEAAAPISALLSNIGNLKDLKITLDTSQGEASRQALEGTGEFQNAVDTLSSTWESFLNNIFEKSKGAFTGVINFATNLIKVLENIPYILTTIGLLIGRTIGKITDRINAEGLVKDITNNLAKEMSLDISRLKGMMDDQDPVSKSMGYKKPNYAEYIKNTLTDLAATEKSLRNRLPFAGKKEKKDINELLTSISSYKKGLKELENISDNNVGIRGLAIKFLSGKKNDEEELKRKKEVFEKYFGEISNIFDKVSSKATKKFNPAEAFNVDTSTGKMDKFKKAIKGLIESAGNNLSILGSKIKSVGSSILNFFGGWIGIAITAIPMVISFFKSWYDEQNKVFKAIDDNFDKVTSDVSTMETEVVSLVNIMKKHNKESAEWKAAYDALNSTFPDIAKQLDLETIYVNNASLAYRNLQDEINGAIKKRKEFLLQEAKVKATSDLLKDYQEKTNKLGEDLVKLLTDSGQTETAAKILVSGLRDEILQILRSDSETKQKDLVDRLGQFFADNNISNPRTYKQAVDNYGNISYVKDGEVLSEKFANKFFSRFSRYQRELDSLDLISGKADTSTFEEIKNRIRNLVSSSMSFGVSRETEIALKEGAMGRNEYQENESVLASYRKILEDLVDSLIKIKEPIDEQGTTALEFAKTLPDYKGIEAKINATLKKLKVLADTAESDPSSIYDTAIKYLDKLFKEGLIKGEVEYNRKKLEAINTYISSLENLKKTDDETISTLKNLNKEREALTKAIEAGVRAEEENKKNIKERQQKVEQISEGRKNAALSSANMKYNKWDSFNFSDKFEYENQFPEK
jgi:TP901 family phage tail tape measure protein